MVSVDWCSQSISLALSVLFLVQACISTCQLEMFAVPQLLMEQRLVASQYLFSMVLEPQLLPGLTDTHNKDYTYHLSLELGEAM